MLGIFFSHDTVWTLQQCDKYRYNGPILQSHGTLLTYQTTQESVQVCVTTPRLPCIIRPHREPRRPLGATYPLELGTKVQRVEAALSRVHRLVAVRATVWSFGLPECCPFLALPRC